MASRMEKYYRSGEDAKKRIYRNEEIYKTIYDDETYTNIEAVVETPTLNEIDINKIREIVYSHEEQKKMTRQLVKRTPELNLSNVEFIEDDENKNYDIKDILESAKSSRETDDENHHRLRNTEYDILKNININVDKENKVEETAVNTSVLNQLGNTELSLNLYEDLQSETTARPSAALLEETNVNRTAEMDKSFYTSSLGFKDNDFDQIQDLNKSLKKNTSLMRIILIILFIIIGALIILGIYKLIF